MSSWRFGPKRVRAKASRRHAEKVGRLLLVRRLRGHWDRGAVGKQSQQSAGRAEGSAGDAVIARPAAVLVLDAVQVVGDGLVPLLPFGAALNQQRLADVHEAEEFLAAVGTES